MGRAGAWLESAILPAALCGVGLAVGWLASALALPETIMWLGYGLAYLAGGLPSLIAGIGSLRDGTVDADLLMVIGAVGAAAIGFWGEGATLLLIFSASHALEEYAMSRSRRALKALVGLRPLEATVEDADGTSRRLVSEVVVGDVVLVRPGEQVPVDGVIVGGESSIDEAAITGESMPVQKVGGDAVFAGTLNQFGALRVSVTKLSEDSTLAKIIRLVEDASAQKASAQRWVDRIAPFYGIGVLAMAGLALIAPGIWTELTWADRIYRAVTLLVVASPCAIVASVTPAVLSAIANASRRGVLFKGGVPLERLASARVFAFDKTGTLTLGRPQVMQVRAHQCDDAELLRVAAAAESLTDHPLARAIIANAEECGILVEPADNGRTIPAYGVVATMGERRICVGKMTLLEREGISIAPQMAEAGQELAARGQTVIYVGETSAAGEGRVLGLIGVADAIRPSAQEALVHLRALGLGPLVVLTGDHERVGLAVASVVSADEVRAMLLPEEKVQAIGELERKHGPVVMVGDGVNDAPALAAAWIGVAMGAAGTDVALETADVALMADELHQLPRAVEIARATRKTVRNNLIFALSVISALVVATVIFGMPLSLAVLGHEGSTLLVIANGLRMLRFQPTGRFADTGTTRPSIKEPLRAR